MRHPLSTLLPLSLPALPPLSPSLPLYLYLQLPIILGKKKWIMEVNDIPTTYPLPIPLLTNNF